MARSNWPILDSESGYSERADDEQRLPTPGPIAEHRDCRGPDGGAHEPDPDQRPDSLGVVPSLARSSPEEHADETDGR